MSDQSTRFPEIVEMKLRGAGRLTTNSPVQKQRAVPSREPSQAESRPKQRAGGRGGKVGQCFQPVPGAGETTRVSGPESGCLAAAENQNDERNC